MSALPEITIRGTITDRQTGETLPGANVYVSDNNGDTVVPAIGTASDGNGNYNLTATGFIPQYITASYVGYGRKTKKAGEMLDFALKPGVDLPEFEVKAKRKKTVVKVIAGFGIAATALLLLLYFSKGKLKPPVKK